MKQNRKELSMHGECSEWTISGRIYSIESPGKSVNSKSMPIDGSCKCVDFNITSAQEWGFMNDMQTIDTVNTMTKRECNWNIRSQTIKVIIKQERTWKQCNGKYILKSKHMTHARSNNISNNQIETNPIWLKLCRIKHETRWTCEMFTHIKTVPMWDAAVCDSSRYQLSCNMKMEWNERKGKTPSIRIEHNKMTDERKNDDKWFWWHCLSHIFLVTTETKLAMPLTVNV